jgi:Glycosyl transferases group 1/Glycosyltransferase Family 4
MRILHIDSGTEMRGGQWQVLRLVEGLQARGHENVLLAREGAPLFEHARTRGIEVRAVNLRSVRQASRRAAVTHAHDSRSHTIAAITAATRLVVSRRVAFAVQRNLVSRWKYTRAVHFIAVSGFVRNTLLDAGIPPSRISIVYDGVPMLPVSHGSEIVVLESRDPRKSMGLALAGVKLAGFAAIASGDLENDLARAGMFVYITESEGLGSAVLLAMAAGVPVIASNVGGIPEIVEHERTGLLIENSSGAIAAAIRRLHDDRLFAQSLAVEARRRVEQRFSVDRMVTDTIAVYEALA